MKWMPTPDDKWDNGTHVVMISPYAYRVGPRWSPRRKIRRKRNRQWVRNIMTAARNIKSLTCRQISGESGLPEVEFELETEVGRVIRHEIMYGTTTGTAAVKHIISNE